ncbi:ribose-phosphate pyrophosphokinase [Longimicrobium sp.]|uniref:ribose-phosphate diphosphokinase n=1 Tax=Longimicrobium sp. TaxID=2029185 RepID=UPI002E36AD0C|nr:ribose-phosphate pyrophosphokinase [Longimicrobium sp.]HEX6041375.1 ribose-phosphate pyrophosphokinase [Longimicrobium sp.]
MSDYILFAGSANPALARAVADTLGVPLGDCAVERFPDGETSVRVLESVRGKDVYLLQPTCPPVNDNAMELLVFADACRRAAAGRIHAVVPYYGYARSDKRHGRREPITASLVSLLMREAGIDHVVTLDLHTDQIEGFFPGPFDTLTAVPTLCAALKPELPAQSVVVAPDAGRVKLATEYAARLDVPLAVLHKRRESGTETHVTHLVGEVEGRACVIIDDMIATGGTLVESVNALREAGAASFVVMATHALLMRNALERLADAGVERVFVTDSVPPREDPRGILRVVSVAPLLASALRHLVQDESLQELF